MQSLPVAMALCALAPAEAQADHAIMSNARWYKERFGDCNVPTTWEENPKLAI